MTVFRSRSLYDDEFVESYRTAIESLKSALGTYHAVAKDMGVSDTAISRARHEGKVFPRMVTYLVTAGLITAPRDRDIILPENDPMEVVRILNEQYPQYVSFMIHKDDSGLVEEMRVLVTERCLIK